MQVSSAGSDSGSAAEAAAAAVPDGSSPCMPSGGSPHDQSLLGGSGPLTSWECRQQQAMQECTFLPRLNTNTKRSKSIVAQVWKPSAAPRANPTVSSAALQPGSKPNAEAAAAADREGASRDSHSPVSSSSASSGPTHAALKPQFVTAPMHHEAARARHRHLVSYAAPAAGAAAAAIVSSQAAVLPDAGARDKGEGKQQPQLQQADAGVGRRELSADEAELQAALQECDRQQQLLQTRWHGKRGRGTGKHCSAAGVR